MCCRCKGPCVSAGPHKCNRSPQRGVQAKTNRPALEKEIKTENELLILDHIKDGIVFTDCAIKNSSDEADRIKKFTNLNKIIEINPIKYRESSESYKFKVEYLSGNLDESIPKLIGFINEHGSKNQITIISEKDSKSLSPPQSPCIEICEVFVVNGNSALIKQQNNGKY